MKSPDAFAENSPLAGSTLNIILRLLFQSRFRVDPPYRERLLRAFLANMLVSPARLREHIQYGPMNHPVLIGGSFI